MQMAMIAPVESGEEGGGVEGVGEEAIGRMQSCAVSANYGMR